MIEAAGNEYDRDARGVWLACRAWLRYIVKRDETARLVKQVVAAEHLIDGEWIDMGATLLPPRLVFGAEA